MKITAAVSRAGAPYPRLEELELEEPRPDEVRVRLVAAGICHTDLLCHAGLGVPTPRPIVLGHEGAGVVESVGEGVQDLAPGDAVVLSGVSCGTCPSCRAARPVYCRDAIRLSFGGARADGTSPLSQQGRRMAGAFFGQSSFATHCVVPQRSAVPVAPDLPLHRLGPLGCGFITGAGSVFKAFKVRPGQSIVIFGTGSVGLAAVMAARIAGASRIVAVDVDARRLALARELGATDAIAFGPDLGPDLKALERFGFDFSFNTTPVPAVYALALECLANEGSAGFVTRPRGEWSPNIASLLAGGRKLQGILGGSANPQVLIPQLLAYWRQGRFAFERLISEFKFADIGEAWQACESGSVVKPVLRM